MVRGKVLIPRTIKDHWDRVGSLRCVVSGAPHPTIHHVHGGSMADAGFNTGMAQRGISDALVIPLAGKYHTGTEGIDTAIDVRTWELLYGTQMEHVEDVSEQLGYDLIELHKLWAECPPKRG